MSAICACLAVTMPSSDFCCIVLLGLGNTGTPINLCLDGGYVASVCCNTVVCVCVIVLLEPIDIFVFPSYLGLILLYTV